MRLTWRFACVASGPAHLQVDPKQLLEDGIRKELVRQVSEAMHSTLTLRAGADLDSALLGVIPAGCVAATRAATPRSHAVLA